MGKGDRRSRKGKIWRGSYGNARPKKSTKNTKVDNTTTKSEEAS